MQTCRIIVPFFGAWPPWFPLYLKSCGYNPSTNWLIVGDAQPPTEVPANVAFLTISFSQLRERISATLGVDTSSIDPYKLCDFKPAYGEIFADEIAGYDFFGWGDLDLIYGQFDKLIAPLLDTHDIISFHSWWLSSHTCLFRSIPKLTSLFREALVWKERMESPQSTCFDDLEFSDVVKKQPRTWMHETFNTPHGKIPWTDGTHRFPARWTWNRGVITNSMDGGYQFAYFHFMFWKAGRTPLRQFKQWPANPLVNFEAKDAYNQDATYVFTNDGIRFEAMKPPRTTLSLLYDDVIPKPTRFNKLYTKIQRKMVAHLGRSH